LEPFNGFHRLLALANAKSTVGVDLCLRLCRKFRVIAKLLRADCKFFVCKVVLYWAFCKRNARRYSARMTLLRRRLRRLGSATHPSRSRYIIPLRTSKTANSARRAANARANRHVPKAFFVAVSRGECAKASARKRVAKVAAKGAGALGLDV
jgi:hypothetical protein